MGITNRDVKSRVQELSAPSAVPVPFVIEYYVLTYDVEEIEAIIHQRLSGFRDSGREFFAIAAHEAVALAETVVRPIEDTRYLRQPAEQPEVKQLGQVTIYRDAESGARFFFDYSREQSPHIHVAFRGQVCTLPLGKRPPGPIINSWNPIEHILVTQEAFFLEKWDEYLGGTLQTG